MGAAATSTRVSTQRCPQRDGAPRMRRGATQESGVSDQEYLMAIWHADRWQDNV
jgi:hypothetical protein